MNQKLLTDLINQLNIPEENEQEGITEITPEEAIEMEGGTVIDYVCPVVGNHGCGVPR
ncbi:hypothetical protein [Spirosoma linguale]|uniref:Uncharacterized protein n=1 Tax=Spirosoma linguale (strain ATCC 33905 / DSM 74 / LMG 10896 / Claus 1) TaxID=504472 RepID=D2QI64_SPILD|nr:hypothetical protein Slin_0898 [Spirosoma linguale DSM 74]